MLLRQTVSNSSAVLASSASPHCTTWPVGKDRQINTSTINNYSIRIRC